MSTFRELKERRIAEMRDKLKTIKFGDTIYVKSGRKTIRGSIPTLKELKFIQIGYDNEVIVFDVEKNQQDEFHMGDVYLSETEANEEINLQRANFFQTKIKLLEKDLEKIKVSLKECREELGKLIKIEE